MVLQQPPPRQAYSPPHINIDGTNLDAVEFFTYLGSVISNNAGSCQPLVQSQQFLWMTVKESMTKSLAPPLPKIQVYRAVVVPTLLYGAETWVLYRTQIRLLERFHQCCLRSNLGIK